MSSIVVQDTRRHSAESNDPHWQESLFLCWTDVRTECAFHCHISLAPFHQKAHVWAWLMVNGEEIARSQEHELSIPADDFDDFTLGVAHFSAGATIRDLHYVADFGVARMEIDYCAFTDPVALHYNTAGLKLGTNHYENMGVVTGSITIGERCIAVRGGAWHDHSWGVRKLSSNPAGRWIWAVFGKDLAFSIFSLTTSAGQVHLGYVLDAGEVHLVETASCGVTVGDDGISPEAADVTVWTNDGRGYVLCGRVTGTALVGGPAWSGDGNFVWMDGTARFEHAGRIGGGIIEVSNLKTPTAAQKLALKL